MNCPRKYHITTYGCQMNKHDSERIASLLNNLGFIGAHNQAEADFILINSCSVRQASEDRIFGSKKEFEKIREANPELVIGVTGCMAGRDKDGKLRSKLPHVDLFFPISDLPQLPRKLAGYFPEINDTTDSVMDFLHIEPKYEIDYKASVTVQTGCNKYCSYCVVPYARGFEKNRPVKDIISEVKNLEDKGCLEIMLLGQAVNAYQAPDPENFSQDNPYKDHFAALLWEVNKFEKINRISFVSPHPLHMTDEVIDALTLPRIANYIHLPVQAGDDEILRRMNRRYTSSKYLDIIKKIRDKKPDIAIGTDIIVGFCGETKEQFENTVELYKKADFDIAYLAMYSPRSGTTSYKAFKDDITKIEKKRRWQVLQDLMEENTYRKNQKYVGKEVEVLVEKFDKGRCFGNSREMKLVEFVGSPGLVGKIVRVKIEIAKTWILSGVLID